MAKTTSSQIRKIYFKQKKIEAKKKLGKGLFTLVLSILAVVFSDSLLQDKKTDN